MKLALELPYTPERSNQPSCMTTQKSVATSAIRPKQKGLETIINVKDNLSKEDRIALYFSDPTTGHLSLVEE